MRRFHLQSDLKELDRKHNNVYTETILPKSGYDDLEEYVNCVVSGLLHLETISSLADPNLIELLCHAFFGEGQKSELWFSCKAPIFSALLVVYISDQMEIVFKACYELDWVDTFEKQKDHFDEQATALLELCHKNSPPITRCLLREGYFSMKRKFSRHFRAHSDEGPPVISLLEVADKANANNFMAHRCSKRFVNDIWEHGHPIGKRGEKQKPAPFYWRPRNVFLLHTLVYFVYLVAYGLFLQHLYSIGSKLSLAGMDVFWACYAAGLIVWQFTMIWETYVTQVKNNRVTYQQQWWDFHRYNLFHLFTLIPAAVFLIMAHFSIVLLPDHPIVLSAFILLYETLFYWNFLYTSLPILLILTISSFFGTIIFTIENMFRTFLRFAPVIFIFWIVYSTVQVSLTDVTMDKNYFWSMFIHGAFELVQDTQDETKLGNIESVGKKLCNATSIESSMVLATQCWLRRGLAPLLLFCYIMGTSVLVINILTTIINQRYDEANAKANNHWNSLKLQRTILYQRKHLPPPLNILVDLVAKLFIKRGITRLRGMEKRKNDYCFGISPLILVMMFYAHLKSIDQLPMTEEESKDNEKQPIIGEKTVVHLIKIASEVHKVQLPRARTRSQTIRIEGPQEANRLLDSKSSKDLREFEQTNQAYLLPKGSIQSSRSLSNASTGNGNQEATTSSNIRAELAGSPEISEEATLVDLQETMSNWALIASNGGKLGTNREAMAACLEKIREALREWQLAEKTVLLATKFVSWKVKFFNHLHLPMRGFAILIQNVKTKNQKSVDAE